MHDTPSVIVIKTTVPRRKKDGRERKRHREKEVSARDNLGVEMGEHRRVIGEMSGGK